MESRQIIKRFLATEKSTITKEAEGKYSFEVDRRANKYQIKSAVEDESALITANKFQVTACDVYRSRLVCDHQILMSRHFGSF